MRKSKKQPLPSHEPLPPYVPVKEAKETPGQLAANMYWLQANWQNYKGVWVALNNGELLCTGAESKDLDGVVTTHPNRINIMRLLVGRDYW